MFERLRRLLLQADRPEARPARHARDERQLAAAALLVETAVMDHPLSGEERALITDLLRRRFELGADEAADLLAEGEAEAVESTDLYRFTRAIKQGFDHDERIELIEMLWEVVYADRRLHDLEASLLRRVTGLLHISDRDSGEARLRVRARLGLA
jgi:uncharacterized tellurite resistance protein B-like protein